MKFKQMNAGENKIELPDLTNEIKKEIERLGNVSPHKATKILKNIAINAVEEQDRIPFTQNICNMLDEKFKEMGLPIETRNLVLEEKMAEDYDNELNEELNNAVKELVLLDRDQNIELIKAMRVEIDKIYVMITIMNKHQWQFRFSDSLELYALNSKSFLGRELKRLGSENPYIKANTVNTIPQTQDVYEDYDKIEQAVYSKYIQYEDNPKLLEFVNDLRDLITSVENKFKTYRDERDYLSNMVERAEMELLNLKNITGYLLMDLREDNITYDAVLDTSKIEDNIYQRLNIKFDKVETNVKEYVDTLIEGIPTRQAFSELYNKLTNVMHELEKAKEQFNVGLFGRIFGKRK